MLNAMQGREARPASASWNVFKTLTQTIVFWGLFLFLLPALLFVLEETIGLAGVRFSAPTWQVLGIAFFVLGGALGLTSGMVMAVKGAGTPLPLDCPRQLV